MDVGVKIKTLLKEAELYRSQSLLNEAKGKYNKAAELIGSLSKVKNKEQLLDGISKKLKSLDLEIEKFLAAPATQEVPEAIQDLIMAQFSRGKEGEAAELEGAIALAKFGQFERALREFSALIQKDSLRSVAAKNIIRCHMSLGSVDPAIRQFAEWMNGGLFSDAQIENLRVFFQNILDKKGLGQQLPTAVAPAPEAAPEVIEPDSLEIELAEPDAGEDELLDVSSIGITFDSGPQKGNLVEFDVSFQSGNEISLLIPSRDKEVIEHLRPGTKIAEIEFYSPFAMFKGEGIILSNTKISTGPKRGDFSLDIKVIRS